jgi:hypothetical protein
MTNVHLPSLDSIEAGAPEQEIDITPEMIEAGAIELAWHGSWKYSNEDVVERIYRAMRLACLPKLDQERLRELGRTHE